MGSLSAMYRRTFVRRLAGLGASVAGLALLNGCGLLPSAAPPAKVPRVRYLGDPLDAPWPSALWDQLGQLGWVEGHTLRVERRELPPAEARPSGLPVLVAELLALPVDVLVTIGTAATLATKQGTDTIPIVFTSVTDPVGVGVDASLARPGGNETQ
jgi:putative ABC transport system substrate-binding protein